MFGKSPFGSTGTSAFGSSSLFGSSSNRPLTGFGTQTGSQSSSLFGQKSIFGSSGQTSSLFGFVVLLNLNKAIAGSSQPASTASTSLFGQSKPLFGSSTTQPTGFSGTTSLFGSNQSTLQTGSGVFGSGFGTPAISGTTIKFEPPTSTDTMIRNGTNQTISTKHICITAMKQYENKSLEELRCDDYLANRKGPQNSGLVFGQGTQSSSLFGSTPNTTQSSIFGQNKPLFGASTGFGTATTTSSSLFGTPATNSSIFGNKSTTGGLFGTSNVASSFGQPQPTTGLFGAKPVTNFGTPTSSLFGGSAFGTATTSSNPFTFGSVAQSATSVASTGLFGTKPATSGFSGFGMSTSLASGTQPASGLFGSKPASGGLFGSGSLFGQTAPSSTPSLFGATTTKPANTLFGSSAPQTTFGPAQQSAVSSVASVAPIVLGANFSQWQIEKAVIDAQLESSPYGDSPLLKILTTESKEQSNIPNPVSVERQMRFLASKKEFAITTTTPSGPFSLGSIPAVASRIRSSSKSRDSIGDFTYHSMFLPPALSNCKKNASLNLDSGNNRSGETIPSSVDPSNFLGVGSSPSPASKSNAGVKRLDLNVLHKCMQESRKNSTPSTCPPTTASGGNDAADHVLEKADANAEIQSTAIEKTPNKQKSVSFLLPPGDKSAANDPVDNMQMSTNPETVLPADSEKETSGKASDFDRTGLYISQINSVHKPHPGGIILTRQDYTCEPSMEELAAMASLNNGVCHIENGFTIRRLAFGSVFWPGSFDLHNLDLDKIVHFRQHEVIVYPDDKCKPPVGEELNRFAEISLDRVWPRDRKTKEFITDVFRLEEIGYRAKLERASIKMGAEFKDYLPDTGTWVFTVPHFTKYGLVEDDSDYMIDDIHLKALNDSKIQDAVQRAKVPELKIALEGCIKDAAKSLSDNSEDNSSRDFSQKIKEVNGDSAFFVRGLGGTNGFNKLFSEQQTVTDSTTTGHFFRSSMFPETDHRMELWDNSVVFEDLLNDSIKICLEEKSRIKSLQVGFDHPVNNIGNFLKEGKQTFTGKAKRLGSVIDNSNMNGRSGRVSWNHGWIYCENSPSHPLSVRCSQLRCANEVPVTYIMDLFQKVNTSSMIAKNGDMNQSVVQNASQSKSDVEFLDLINSFLVASKSSGIVHDLEVFELCDALFSSQIAGIISSFYYMKNIKISLYIQETSDAVRNLLFNSNTTYTKMLNRRENVAEWLQKCLMKREQYISFPQSGPTKILHYMLNGDLKSAVDEAINNNFPHLAFALSTFKYTKRAAYKNQVFVLIALFFIFHNFLSQIARWKETKEYKFINVDLLKIYLIMAGEMQVNFGDRIVFVNEGLDGLQALNTFVWYYDPFDASLVDVLLAFENDLKSRKVENELEHNIFYELIQLACDMGRSLDSIIEPDYMNLDSFDYHLCWHLWLILRIWGFKHISKHSEHKLHIRYSEQLCQLELYHLAAIVLMHLSDLHNRNNALNGLFDRIAYYADRKTYTDLSKIVHLPNKLIARSRYMRAKLDGNEDKICFYALQSGMFEEAHLVFFEKVAPHMIISDEYDSFGKLSKLFEDVCDQIPAWGPYGQVFIDFYGMKKKLEEVQDDNEMKDLVDLAHSLESRLIAMHVTTPIQKLAVTLISRYVYKIIYGYEGTVNANLPLSYEDTLEVANDLALHSYFSVDTPTS
ncbi:unnamed protein product [Thelazia callipaeda]|uniref:Nuclear pore complex protein Nup98-Nup96 n=1 Tax=Thelazia callipaeda TaxID=103827 RepID=A0A0N5DB08_THECL|nr:unnamed protein product [Thelazia callipaeda]